MKSPYDIILRPVITERSMEKAGDKIYVFEVARDANKIEIREAVESIFNVDVLSVNTMNLQGKVKRMGVHIGRRAARKKAIVRLVAQSKPIEFFEGMV
ncbi:MAG: 50S ribosomal protein L23 [Oscillospiraceae bacterium]|jgi:large subunit ribosomal protein L23|nr:50S ribosomal protein L23 [Oscillospiraceae bacterium]